MDIRHNIRRSSEYSGNERLSNKAPGGGDLLLTVDPRSAKLRWQIVREGSAISRQFAEMNGVHRFGLISLAIYALELGIAIRVTFRAGPPEGFVYTILGLYGYALGTCWTLLGSRGETKIYHGLRHASITLVGRGAASPTY